MTTSIELDELENSIQHLTALLTCLGAVDPDNVDACRELPYAIAAAKTTAESVLVKIQNMK